jgi:hypothetical protein
MKASRFSDAQNNRHACFSYRNKLTLNVRPIPRGSESDQVKPIMQWLPVGFVTGQDITSRLSLDPGRVSCTTRCNRASGRYSTRARTSLVHRDSAKSSFL